MVTSDAFFKILNLHGI